ncbi:MAG: 50S ribosomal protein L24 [Bacillota bacterium]|jgi:large subunit ribosomal protein L24
MAREILKAKKMHIKKGDTVVVISGKDAGKKGKVIAAEPKKNRVYVEKVNLVSRHTKPTKASPQGGIIKKEAGIDVSNVMIFCSHCNKPVRIGNEIAQDGSKQRKCSKCGSVFDK